jgi:tRNA dimethylallyltransferase
VKSSIDILRLRAEARHRNPLWNESKIVEAKRCFLKMGKHPAILNSRSDPFVLLAGPTASGKSAVAIELAKRIGGEIISVDSMQVYRGMDVGTAKPSAAERQAVPHHLIDVASITEQFEAARFVRLASQAAADVVARSGIPVFCGGTGLYFNALLYGLGQSPPADAALRKLLEQTPIEALLEELKKTDADTYERIDRKNPRRVIRAVEVIRLTGKPVSAQRAPWPAESQRRLHSPSDPSGPSYPAFGLAREPTDLRQRIDSRVEEMFRAGLVAETQALLRQGLADNPTAMQALGYRQVVDHLRGQRGLAETIELVKTRTRQFAKRQMTWFRNRLPLEWLAVRPDEHAAPIAERIAKQL